MIFQVILSLLAILFFQDSLNAPNERSIKVLCHTDYIGIKVFIFDYHSGVKPQESTKGFEIKSKVWEYPSSYRIREVQESPLYFEAC